MACDFLVVDLDALEERLVEEAALGRVALKVGSLDVVGQFEREVECVDYRILVDLVATEKRSQSLPLTTS